MGEESQWEMKLSGGGGGGEGKFKNSYSWLEKEIILDLDSYVQDTQNVKKNRFIDN